MITYHVVLLILSAAVVRVVITSTKGRSSTLVRRRWRMKIISACEYSDSTSSVLDVSRKSHSR